MPVFLCLAATHVPSLSCPPVWLHVHKMNSSVPSTHGSNRNRGHGRCAYVCRHHQTIMTIANKINNVNGGIRTAVPGQSLAQANGFRWQRFHLESQDVRTFQAIGTGGYGTVCSTITVALLYFCLCLTLSFACPLLCIWALWLMPEWCDACFAFVCGLLNQTPASHIPDPFSSNERSNTNWHMSLSYCIPP